MYEHIITMHLITIRAVFKVAAGVVKLIILASVHY